MSTHVYVLQRLKALGDGENGATILALDPMGKCAERLLLRSAATDYTLIYTVHSIQTGKCLEQISAQKIVWVQSYKGDIVFCIGSQWRLMCKSDYHESAWNCAELTDISDIFIRKKSQKFSFSVVVVIRGQSRGYTWFSRLLMVIAQIRKNENLRCIWIIDCLSQVYRLATSFSSKYASHLRSKLFLH